MPHSGTGGVVEAPSPAGGELVEPFVAGKHHRPGARPRPSRVPNLTTDVGESTSRLTRAFLSWRSDRSRAITAAVDIKSAYGVPAGLLRNS